MAASPVLPGMHSPAAGFDQPFEMLAACHDRVRRSLDLLQRLVEHLPRHGADRPARDAAADVLRYFDIAAPAHHEDEERHVIPRLQASGDAGLQAVAARMLADHVEIRRAWQALRPLLQALRDDGQADVAALGEAAAAFVRVHGPHLALEDGTAFGAAAQRAGAEGPDAVAAMGAEMAARRGAARAQPSST